jgi:hypothetical protein
VLSADRLLRNRRHPRPRIRLKSRLLLGLCRLLLEGLRLPLLPSLLLLGHRLHDWRRRPNRWQRSWQLL